MSGVDSDLIRGHIDTIILKVLSEGNKYGYEICKDVEEKSGGTYELKQPTLYSCLKRLESQGLISSYWEDSDIGGKRHYYKLTKEGKEAYRKNQEEWLRSRQIIDNLISNSQEIASSYSLVKTEEIEELEKRAELNEEIIKEQQKEVSEPTTLTVEPVSFEGEEIIPWGEVKNQEENVISEEIKPETNLNTDEEEITYTWNKFVDMSNENEKVLVEVAPNGEETAAYVDKIEYVESSEETISDNEETISDNEELEEDLSPAQGSIFEEEGTVFDDEQYKVYEQDKEDEVDILALLGHKPSDSPTQETNDNEKDDLIEYNQEPMIEHNQEPMIEHNQEPLLEYTDSESESESEEESIPFNFNMDDFVTKSRNSYFESNEDATPDYIAPTMKIDEQEEKEEPSQFDFEAFKKSKLEEDEIYSNDLEKEVETNQEEDFSTPVYHDFGASSYNYSFSESKNDDDDIYVDTSNVNEEEIYLNPNQTTSSDNNDDGLKLFGEDIFEENNIEFEEEKAKEQSSENSEETFNDLEIIRPENKQSMEFYKTTENYEMLTPKFTEDEYKEKLSTLMSYTNDKEQYDIKEVNYSFENKPKDYLDLKAEFEKEGLVVRTHHKMVKESRHTRSYVESNKLNLVNSWTAFGIISFLITLTYLIMNNYIGGGVASYDFSYKYFLIGIGCLAFIPALYTLLYFINPYKKKPARYASRIYLLFAILLTVQFLLIIYCLNLQMGFYSFKQANYNHLFWIVPSLMSLYPLADAILHTIYFKSKNFHV